MVYFYFRLWYMNAGKNCNFLVSLYLHFDNIDLFSSDFLLHLFA